MERSSKNLMELFMEKYPFEEISSNPLQLAEALGFLRCLTEFSPALEDEILIKELKILLMLRLNLQ